MNSKFNKYFMLLCIVGMGVMMYILISTGSNLSINETKESFKFNPIYLILLLCLLMHILMMKGHGGSCHKQEDNNNTDCNKKT